MGTRKLRLILLAYLRGETNLVRADYPQGVKSVLRERLVLDATEADTKSRHGFEHYMLQATVYAPHLDPAKIKQSYRTTEKELQKIHVVGLMGLHERVDHKPKGSVDVFAKLYQSLQKTKFFDMIREQHFHINPQERPDA